MYNASHGSALASQWTHACYCMAYIILMGSRIDQACIDIAHACNCVACIDLAHACNCWWHCMAYECHCMANTRTAWLMQAIVRLNHVTARLMNATAWLTNATAWLIHNSFSGWWMPLHGSFITHVCNCMSHACYMQLVFSWVIDKKSSSILIYYQTCKSQMGLIKSWLKRSDY